MTKDKVWNIAKISCLADYQHFLQMSFKSIHSFSSYFASNQTNGQTPAVTPPPPLAEVIIGFPH